MVIRWKSFAEHACRLILLMDKAINLGKKFAFERKTPKTAKVFPLECFAVYGMYL